MEYDFKSRDRNRNSLKDYWNRWPWEWFLTARLNNQYYGLILKRFRIALQKDEHLQIAYVGLYVSYPQPHLHILMLGQNREGKSLSSVDSKSWEREWQKITHNTAIIESIYDQEGVVSYMVIHNTPNNHHEELMPYNRKLLKRMKIK